MIWYGCEAQFRRCSVKSFVMKNIFNKFRLQPTPPPLSAPVHTLPVFKPVLKDGLDAWRCINGVSFFAPSFFKCHRLTQIFSASFYTVFNHAVGINRRQRPLEVSQKAFLDPIGSFYIQVSARARRRRDSRWLTYSSSSLASFMSSCSS